MSDFLYTEEKFKDIKKTTDLFYLPKDVTLRKYEKEIFLNFKYSDVLKNLLEEKKRKLYFKNSDEKTELKYTKLELHICALDADTKLKYDDIKDEINEMQNSFRNDESSLSNIYIIKQKDASEPGIYECIFYPVILQYLLKSEDLDKLKSLSNNISQLSHKFLSYYLDDISEYKGFTLSESNFTSNSDDESDNE
tara:strand:- start:319 stop:900 length:582 start_codon:yes stop_codon:yes gene_type:complete